MSGLLNQGSLTSANVINFQAPLITVSSSASVSPDGGSDAGTWACTAGCAEGGTFTGTRIVPHSEGQMPPSGALTVNTPLNDELTVPDGALPSGTTVTVDFDTLPAAPPAGLVALSRAYVLGPEGATFGQPATLVIHYTVEDLGGTADPSTLRVYVYNSVSGGWDFLGGTVDTGAMTLTVEIGHFSIFAVLGSPLSPPTETPTVTPTPTATPGVTPTPTSERPPVNPRIDKTVNGQQGPMTVTVGDSVTYRWVVTGDRLFEAHVVDDTHPALDGDCTAWDPCEKTAVVTLLTPGPVTDTAHVTACGVPPGWDLCTLEGAEDSVTVYVVTPTPSATPTPTPRPIGGIVGLPAQAGTSPGEGAGAAEGSAWPAGGYAALAGVGALALMAIAAGGWYARRRLLR
jgi:hypothetical protein